MLDSVDVQASSVGVRLGESLARLTDGAKDSVGWPLAAHPPHRPISTTRTGQSLQNKVGSVSGTHRRQAATARLTGNCSRKPTMASTSRSLDRTSSDLIARRGRYSGHRTRRNPHAFCRCPTQATRQGRAKEKSNAKGRDPAHGIAPLVHDRLRREDRKSQRPRARSPIRPARRTPIRLSCSGGGSGTCRRRPSC